MLEPIFDQKISIFNLNLLNEKNDKVKSKSVLLPVGSCFIVAHSLSPSSMILTRGTRKYKR